MRDNLLEPEEIRYDGEKVGISGIGPLMKEQIFVLEAGEYISYDNGYAMPKELLTIVKSRSVDTVYVLNDDREIGIDDIAPPQA